MLPLFTSVSAAPVPLWLVADNEFAAWVRDQGDRVAAWARANGFTAQDGRILLIPSGDGGLAGAALGLGANSGHPPFALAALASILPAGDYVVRADAGLAAERLALGWALGGYRFERYKKTNDKAVARLVVADSHVGEEASRIAEAVTLVRDLVNTPANDMGPAELAAVARTLAAQHGAEITVISGGELSERFPLVATVGQAAARPPLLIDMVWGDSAAPKVTLVGKGVCFDSGGLDLKSRASMELMKKDMGGAANVLGLARLIMAAGLRIRLRVIVPAVENSVAGNAYRPGDILRSRKGLSVEIGDTDAEGRLVLADALDAAAAEAPDLVIDLATLTGAARTALGPEIPAFYTDDDALAAAVTSAAARVADPLWRMPLWPGYESWLSSKVADLNNVADSPFAGSITAALFLKRFVDGAKSWMHVDIYAWNAKALPGQPVGGEAQAIRALYDLLRSRYAMK